MDSFQLVATLLGAGGGGAVLLALINGFIKWVSGASGRERLRNTDLSSQRMRAIEERDKANERADLAEVRSRMVAEYASSLRRQLIENGFDPDDWPGMTRTVTKAQLKRLHDEPKKEE